MPPLNTTFFSVYTLLRQLNRFFSLISINRTMTPIKKKSIVYLFLFILFVSSHVSGRESGAGGVLYTTIQGTTYLLLADHTYNKRGWAAFGGRLDGQSPITAAAREIEEETNGVVNRNWTIKQLPSSPVHTVRDGTWHYTMYFLEIPFKPAVQFTSANPPVSLKGTRERGPYTWVKLSVVMSALDQYRSGKELVKLPDESLPPNRKSSWFWPVFLNSLDLAEKQGIFPW